MNCPQCNSKLQVESYEGVEIDRCSNCSGVFLDKGELIQIVTTIEETFEKEVVQETIHNSFAGVPKEEVARKVSCPSCHEDMNPRNFDYQSGIIIDMCGHCHGVWLDSNELDKVQSHKEFWDKERAESMSKWDDLYKMTKIHGQANDLQQEQEMKKGSQKFLAGRAIVAVKEVLAHLKDKKAS